MWAYVITTLNWRIYIEFKFETKRNKNRNCLLGRRKKQLWKFCQLVYISRKESREKLSEEKLTGYMLPREKLTTKMVYRDLKKMAVHRATTGYGGKLTAFSWPCKTPKHLRQDKERDKQ